jgi:hypothetical protein
MSSAKEEFGIELLLGNIPASSSHFINFCFSGCGSTGSADASWFDTERCEGRLWYCPKLYHFIAAKQTSQQRRPKRQSDQSGY